jgi:hypothetical protein
MTVSGQRLGKHVPPATNTRAKIVTLGSGVFLGGPCRDVINKGQSQLLGSPVRESVKIELARVKLKNLYC